jgi:hypothetical protein
MLIEGRIASALAMLFQPIASQRSDKQRLRVCLHTNAACQLMTFSIASKSPPCKASCGEPIPGNPYFLSD